VGTVEREPARGLLNAVAGARVNPDSQQRRYELDGYEDSVYIDTSRSEASTVRSDRPNPEQPEGNAVMYEVAAVSAKLRNVGIVGGERVKEMDHYVAQVETPVVSTRRPAGRPPAISVVSAQPQGVVALTSAAEECRSASHTRCGRRWQAVVAVAVGRCRTAPEGGGALARTCRISPAWWR
jgi:hypothetical protein